MPYVQAIIQFMIRLLQRLYDVMLHTTEADPTIYEGGFV